MEDKKTRRVHFNLFDALIIVVVLAALGGVLLLRNRVAEQSGGGAARETHTMRYTVELLQAPYGMVDCLTVGDAIYRSTDGTYMGTLVDFSYQPHKTVEYSPAVGRYVTFEYEENCDLYLTLENEGYATERDIVIGSIPIKIGNEAPVKGKGYAKAGYVYSIDPMGAEVPAAADLGTGSLEAVYAIRFATVRDPIAANFHVGDLLYEDRSGAKLGVIERIDSQPARHTVAGLDGTAQYAEIPNNRDLTVYVRGRAVDKPDGYYLDGGFELKVGAVVDVRSQYMNRQGVYTELVSIGEAG